MSALGRKQIGRFHAISAPERTGPFGHFMPISPSTHPSSAATQIYARYLCEHRFNNIQRDSSAS
jgi:hypothetical protein